MAWDDALPFGLRDTRITPYSDSAGSTLGTAVDGKNARTMSFSEAEDYITLRGDDAVKAIRGVGPSVDWEMEHGGISLPAYKAMAGGTLATTGTTPAQITTYTKKYTDVRPYFKAEGQAISDAGGDFHGILYKCRASNRLNGELADSTFWLTGAAGLCLPATLAGKTDVLYDFILNETITAIP